MDKGILYIAFGEDYVRLMEATRKITRKFTDLPIHVLTNVEGVEDSTYIGWPQMDNREAKVRMVHFTPFDTTLYIDVDTIFQKPFEMPEFNGLLVNLLAIWNAEKLPLIFKKHMTTCLTRPPMNIFNGAFLGFKKEDAGFFDLWYHYWMLTGCGRDMAPLNCAIKNTGISTTWIRGLFNPGDNDPEATIQHDNGSDFFERNNLPRPKPFKPFDSDPTDWNWTQW